MHESVKLYMTTDNKYILQQADNQQTYEFTATTLHHNDRFHSKYTCNNIGL